MRSSEPPPLSIEDRCAVQAWNLMGGEVNWSALPLLMEMLGVQDPELFVHRLTVIRDAMKPRNA